jgi:hypothetical protein
LNGVLNRTVSDSRLSVRPIDGHDGDAYELTRLVDAARVPCDLDGTTARLRIQEVVVVDDDRCRTESATFSLQADASRKSWLIRWDYVRDPRKSEYAYPRAHVHVNATFADESPVGRLHIPTSRVSLELAIRHLITDWNVKPRTEDWEAILEESAEAFDHPSH